MHPLQQAVDFDHFAAIDLRVGRVVDVQSFPEALVGPDSGARPGDRIA